MNLQSKATKGYKTFIYLKKVEADHGYYCDA